MAYGQCGQLQSGDDNLDLSIADASAQHRADWTSRVLSRRHRRLQARNHMLHPHTAGSATQRQRARRTR